MASKHHQGPNPTSSNERCIIDGYYYPMAKRLVKREEEIQASIKYLAQRLAIAYKDSGISPDKPLILIGVLKGAYIFTSDLIRYLNDAGVPHIVDFVRVSSYASGTQSTGRIDVLMDIKVKIQNAHVIIVEDIVDSGLTLKFLYDRHLAMGPKSLKTLVLADKPEGRKVPFEVDFKCFDVPNEYVVGYGFDLNDRFRCMRHIVVLKPECYEGPKQIYSIPVKVQPTIELKGIAYPMAESVVKTESEIQQAIKALALRIKAQYAGGELTAEKPLVIIGVLKGAYMLTCDLSRELGELGVHHVTDFLRISSYGSGTTSSGKMNLVMDSSFPLEGHHCIVVEDIADSGHTLVYLRDLLLSRGPASLKTLALADKTEGRQVPFDVDFVGFQVPNKFLVGYGLDFNERYRELRHIFVLKPECYMHDKKIYLTPSKL